MEEIQRADAIGPMSPSRLSLAQDSEFNSRKTSFCSEVNSVQHSRILTSLDVGRVFTMQEIAY